MSVPILITVYDRLEHLKTCINSLRTNRLAKETDLYVVSDAEYCDTHKAAIVNVRQYLTTVEGFHTINIIAWIQNKGAVKSAQDAMQLVFNRHNALIFMEDDCQVSPFFLDYMNQAMEKFMDDSSVFAICGYMYPEIGIQSNVKYLSSYFLRHYSAYGVGLWKNKYNAFYNESKNYINTKDEIYKQYKKVSPASAYNIIRMKRKGDWYGDTLVNYYLFKHHKVCLFPENSLVKNNGYDGSGVHCQSVDERMSRQIICSNISEFMFPNSTEIDSYQQKKIMSLFRYPFWRKWKTFLYDCKVDLKNKLKNN